MGWIEVVDGLLWLANLVIVFLLAQAIYRQQKGTAEKLCLGMVTALSLSIVRHVMEVVCELLDSILPFLTDLGIRDFFHDLWPVDIAALVIFVSLSLHFALVFPRFSSLLRRWPRLPYLIYSPALASHLRIGSTSLKSSPNCPRHNFKESQTSKFEAAASV